MRAPILHGKPGGSLLAAGSVLIATCLFIPFRDLFAKGQWALLYLLIITLVAGASGVMPALVAAVLSFCAWNFFFLPPAYTFAGTPRRTGSRCSSFSGWGSSWASRPGG